MSGTNASGGGRTRSGRPFRPGEEGKGSEDNPGDDPIVIENSTTQDKVPLAEEADQAEETQQNGNQTGTQEGSRQANGSVDSYHSAVQFPSGQRQGPPPAGYYTPQPIRHPHFLGLQQQSQGTFNPAPLTEPRNLPWRGLGAPAIRERRQPQVNRSLLPQMNYLGGNVDSQIPQDDRFGLLAKPWRWSCYSRDAQPTESF